MFDRFFKNEIDDREEMKKVFALFRPQTDRLLLEADVKRVQKQKANYRNWTPSRSIADIAENFPQLAQLASSELEDGKRIVNVALGRRPVRFRAPEPLSSARPQAGKIFRMARACGPVGSHAQSLFLNKEDEAWGIKPRR